MPRKQAIIIARERIEILLKLALETASVNMRYAEYYVKLALRIAERFNLRNKSILRRYFRCSKCKNVIIPGRTCRIRILKKRGIGVICLKCGYLKTIPVLTGKR
ncbi:MAG: hypothetical protein ACUVQ0_01125 [Thermoproteota archaeon]